MTKQCGTCKHWDIDSARGDDGEVQQARMVDCLYPLPLLPESCYGYYDGPTKGSRLMPGSYGASCEVYDPLTIIDNPE